MPNKKRKSRRPRYSQKAILIYHDMRVEENFERAAQRIFSLIQEAARSEPSKPRILVLDIQGHRNPNGAFDHDAFELMGHFMLTYLSPYLSEIQTPMYHTVNKKRQKNDVPDSLYFIDPNSEHEYDHQALDVRARDHVPNARSSRPSVQAIADYLGMSPVCIICWKSPVERAHVVPKSLGGSNDVRNFALLCTKHHKEAPDVADAEAFWSWVDYAGRRDGHEKWSDVDPKLLAKIGLKHRIPSAAQSSASHWSVVRTELTDHYDWKPEDFSAASLDELMEEFHTVMESATTTHFGLRKKASTEAWAFEIARRRVANRSKE